jgi:hypothetical protein
MYSSIHMKPFSIRNRPQPDSLTYEIKPNVRARVIRTLEQWFRQAGTSFPGALHHAENKCLAQYGAMREPARPYCGWLPMEEQLIVEHFVACPVEEALDFVEWIFQASDTLPFGHTGVEAINEIFREEGVGYELTKYVSEFKALPGGGGHERISAFPQIVKKSNDLLHQSTVLPALKILAHPAFAVANAEMLQAHKLFREGKFTESITACGQTLESVLKIICNKKKWPYQPNYDPLGRLVKVTSDKQLFFDFYEGVLTSCGTIRNRIGAHGKATTSYPPAATPHAEHMIGLSSANIVFLARMAGMA